MRVSPTRTSLAAIIIAGTGLSLALICTGCRPRSSAAVALAEAQRRAAMTTDADRKIVLLTGIGVELMRSDPQQGKAILGEARQLALTAKNAGPTARLYAISRHSYILAALDRRRALAILSQAIEEAERVIPPSRQGRNTSGDGPVFGPLSVIDSASTQYGTLLAALASLAPDRALAIAKRLPDDARKRALESIAESIARTDLPRAVEIMAAALKPPRPAWGFEWWRWQGLCVAAAARQPYLALRLAGEKIHDLRGRARVLEAVVSALARKDRHAAEAVISRETDPVVRAHGWVVLAHQPPVNQRDTAILRAAEALRAAKLPHATRSMVVEEWSLLAVMARPATLARQYLSAAEAAQDDPPLDYQRGVIMAAACYVDRAKAISIHRELLAKRRTGPNRRSVDTVLFFTNRLVARVDVREAERTAATTPDWGVNSAADQLAQTALQTLPLDGKDRARQLARAAERELATQQSKVRSGRGNYDEESQLSRTITIVATALAATGDESRAFRIARRIRDPALAGETYLAIAASLALQRPAHSDAYQALRFAFGPAIEMLSTPYEPEKRQSTGRRQAPALPTGRDLP